MSTLSEKKQQLDALFNQIVAKYQTQFPILLDYQLRFNQTKRTMGSCYYNKKQIFISAHILKSNPISIQIETLKHEIAHAIAHTLGERAHGKIWQHWAVELGTSPDATYKEKNTKTSAQSSNTQPTAKLIVEYKYRLICLHNNQLTLLDKQYHRKTSLKGRYLLNNEATLNCLYLVENKILDLYQMGKLTLDQLSSRLHQ